MTRSLTAWVCAAAAAAAALLAAPISAQAHHFAVSDPTVIAGPDTVSPVGVVGPGIAGGAVFLIPAWADRHIIAGATDSVAVAEATTVFGKRLPRFPVEPINTQASVRAVVRFTGVAAGEYLPVTFTAAQVANNSKGFVMPATVRVQRATPSTGMILAPVRGFPFQIGGVQGGDTLAFKPAAAHATTPAQCRAFCVAVSGNASTATTVTTAPGGTVYATFAAGAVGEVGPMETDCVCIRKSIKRTLGGSGTAYWPTPGFTRLALDVVGPLATNAPPLVTAAKFVRIGQEITMRFATPRNASVSSSFNVALASVAPYAYAVSGSPNCAVVAVSRTALTCRVTMPARQETIVVGVWGINVTDASTGQQVAVVAHNGRAIAGRAFVIIELPPPAVTSVSGKCAAKSADCAPHAAGTLRVTFHRPGFAAWTDGMALRFTPLAAGGTPIECADDITITPSHFECSLRRASTTRGSWEGSYRVDLVTHIAASPVVEQSVHVPGTLALGRGDAPGFIPAPTPSPARAVDAGAGQGHVDASPPLFSLPLHTVVLISSGAVLVVALALLLAVVLMRRQQRAVTIKEADLQVALAVKV